MNAPASKEEYVREKELVLQIVIIGIALQGNAKLNDKDIEIHKSHPHCLSFMISRYNDLPCAELKKSSTKKTAAAIESLILVRDQCS